MHGSERVEFEWVFRSAYPSVLRTTFLVLHDRGRAEEVTQDAFLRLYERWRGVSAIEHPEAWVRRVAVRAAVRSAKQTRLRTAAPPDDEQPWWEELPDVDLARAVASLAPQQRAAVALFYLDDLSVEDEGWYSDGGWVIDSGNSVGGPEQIGQISVWSVDRVFDDPCHHPGTGTDAGRTVAELARSLARQPGPSTPPQPVVLDGHRGLALEVTVPPDTDITRCTADQYALWRAADDSVHAVDAAGVVHHLRILDVDGTRLVVVATAYPDQPHEQPEDLVAIAETITFEAAAS